MSPETTRRITLVALASFWTWAILTVFTGSLPDSPMRMSRQDHIKLVTVLPEGWGFFTRSPREPELLAWGRRGDRWERLSFGATSPENRYGWTRRSRIQGVELGGLLASVPPDAWTAHPDPLAAGAVLDSLPRFELHNRALARTLCGELLLERRPPVPWAWSRARDRVRMPAEWVRVQVDCSAAARGGEGDA